MNEVEHAEIEPHRVLEDDVFDGGVLGDVYVDAKRGEPRACWLVLECDFLDVLVVGEVSAEANRDFTGFAVEFLEDEKSAAVRATLCVEFEARLPVRETPELSWTLPVQSSHVVAFCFEFPEILDVVADTFNRFLEDGGVYLCEVDPPVFECGKRVSYHPDALSERSGIFGDMFDVRALLPEDADVETPIPSFATWNEASSEYAEDDVLRLLQEIRDCLRDRGFNAFLAIDVGIPLEEMDAASQSIAFARASNLTVFIAPQVGDNLGVGIEIGSILEDLLATDGMRGPPADATPPDRARRLMVATEPSVRSAMLGSVNTRWDTSVRKFTDAADCCRLCAQFCTHIQNEECYGTLDRLD